MQNRSKLKAILASAGFVRHVQATDEEYGHLTSARLALLDALIYKKGLIEAKLDILEDIHLDMPPQDCPPIPSCQLAQRDRQMLLVALTRQPERTVVFPDRVKPRRRIRLVTPAVA